VHRLVTINSREYIFAHVSHDIFLRVYSCIGQSQYTPKIIFVHRLATIYSWSMVVHVSHDTTLRVSLCMIAHHNDGCSTGSIGCGGRSHYYYMYIQVVGGVLMNTYNDYKMIVDSILIDEVVGTTVWLGYLSSKYSESNWSSGAHVGHGLCMLVTACVC
jgi:hypothetical protein